MARLRAKLAPALVPLLQQHLEALAHPMLLAMGRLDDRQRETRGLVEQLVLLPQEQPVTAELRHRELTALLMEVLQALQPPPEQEIAQQLGLPVPPTSRPSSAS